VGLHIVLRPDHVRQELLEHVDLVKLHMNAFKVALQVSLLTKPFVACDTNEWFFTSVFLKMIPDITAFSKYNSTAGEVALKVLVVPPCLPVKDLYHLVVFVGDSFKVFLHFGSVYYHLAIILRQNIYIVLRIVTVTAI
jgi:hypothetical protein